MHDDPRLTLRKKGRPSRCADLSAVLAGGARVVAADPEAAKARLGDGFAETLLLDQQASGAKVRTIGGWAPTRPMLLEELAR